MTAQECPLCHQPQESQPNPSLTIETRETYVYLNGKKHIGWEAGGTSDMSKYFRLQLEDGWYAVDSDTWKAVEAAYGEIVKKQIVQ